MTEELDRDQILTMRDVRKVHMCSYGACRFFRAHDLDWHDFLKNGIRAGILIDTGDAMALDALRKLNGRK
jgi:hypothetical protein